MVAAVQLIEDELLLGTVGLRGGDGKLEFRLEG